MGVMMTIDALCVSPVTLLSSLSHDELGADATLRLLRPLQPSSSPSSPSASAASASSSPALAAPTSTASALTASAAASASISTASASPPRLLHDLARLIQERVMPMVHTELRGSAVSVSVSAGSESSLHALLCQRDSESEAAAAMAVAVRRGTVAFVKVRILHAHCTSMVGRHRLPVVCIRVWWLTSSRIVAR